MNLHLPQNPLLANCGPPVVDASVIRTPVVQRPIARKSVAMLRKENAAEAVASLERDGRELFGLTRGQFSLSDMLEAILVKTGPAAMGISTWTAAHSNVERMMALLEGGQITSCRWLVDQTFVRRCPALAQQIRTLFGDDAIRVTKTHAKFATVVNKEWKVALRSSMNLNQNPRLESFQVGHDPELCNFLSAAMNDIWRRQDRRLQEASSSAVTQWWNEQ